MLHHCFLLQSCSFYLLIFLFAFFIYLLCISFSAPTCFLPSCLFLSCLFLTSCLLLTFCASFFLHVFCLSFSLSPLLLFVVNTFLFLSTFILTYSYYTDYLYLFFPTRILRVCSITFLFRFSSSPPISC